jgi:hypothetical protein
MLAGAGRTKEWGGGNTIGEATVASKGTSSAEATSVLIQIDAYTPLSRGVNLRWF